MVAPERLSRSVRKTIEAGPNVLSVISYWEVMLKEMRGKLPGIGDPRSWWDTAVSDFAATSLPLRAEHITELHNLPLLHRDPFDRMLIAQALVEDLTLVTVDEHIPQYATKRFRVIR